MDYSNATMGIAFLWIGNVPGLILVEMRVTKNIVVRKYISFLYTRKERLTSTRISCFI